jgi:hypothetical protein
MIKIISHQEYFIKKEYFINIVKNENLEYLNVNIQENNKYFLIYRHNIYIPIYTKYEHIENMNTYYLIICKENKYLAIPLSMKNIEIVKNIEELNKCINLEQLITNP